MAMTAVSGVDLEAILDKDANAFADSNPDKAWLLGIQIVVRYALAKDAGAGAMVFLDQNDLLALGRFGLNVR